MPLLPADYVVIGLTVVLSALGLVRGFSGAFAFLVGTSFGIAAVVGGWNGLLAGIDALWLRVAAAVLVFVVAFGIVRILVKLVVGKLLEQPSDSIFGVCLGLFCGGFLIWTLANNPQLRGYSFVAQEVHALVR